MTTKLNDALHWVAETMTTSEEDRERFCRRRWEKESVVIDGKERTMIEFVVMEGSVKARQPSSSLSVSTDVLGYNCHRSTRGHPKYPFSLHHQKII